jgi:acetylornithine deacetylase/succinyl-diaminopimelate desuccinylase-like protein
MLTGAAPDAAALAGLAGFLRIQSVSADPGHADDVVRAVEWVADVVRGAGGTARLVELHGRPLVDALLPAGSSGDGGRTLLCYGHVDVQPPAPLDAWTSDPFEPVVRDGWLHARGVADDKGQLWALLRAATDLATRDALPWNVRFCCDGEEEIGGTSIVEHLERDDVRPDACLIFDTPMLDGDTVVFTLATRGTLYVHLEVETGARDLHSGVYGGAALNALHVLVDALGRVLPRDGRLPAVLREGTAPPSEAEVSEWRRLPPGAELLAAEGAAVADSRAASELYLRTWALPSLDVNGIEGGSPVQQKTIVVSQARANLSMRLAPGQTVERLAPAIERELRRALPPSARLRFEVTSACDPGRVPASAAFVQTAANAFERTLGRRPLLLRSGGSLPIMPLLERLGIPAVVTGFNVPESNVHAPNERMPLAHLGAAIAAATETMLALAEL